MNRIEYLNQQIKILQKELEKEINLEVKRQLQAEKQALARIKHQSTAPTKRTKYTYRNEQTRQAAIQRGRELRARQTAEKRAEIEESRKQGLEIYREANKQARKDTTYAQYWNEIKSLRAQAKIVGVRFNLKNVSVSPTQVKESRQTPETLARYSLGLASRIDVEQIMLKAEADGIIFPILDQNNQVIGYTYDGKGYSLQDMKLMMSAPKKFFPANSIFWNWVSGYYYANGGGDSGAEAVSSEIFGS